MDRTRPTLLRHASTYRGIAALLVVGCATAPPDRETARMVAPSEWSTVVDCVVLSARASEFVADVDAGGISITSGVMPFGPFHPGTRSSALGRVRIAREATADGLRVTTGAYHWGAFAFRRDSMTPSAASRAIATQFDAQCFAGYPSVAAR
jgi:hypothetical protein